AGQLTAGREGIAGPQPAVDDGPPDLAVDLAGEVLAPHQADVEVHPAQRSPRPGLAWCGLAILALAVIPSRFVRSQSVMVSNLLAVVPAADFVPALDWYE